MMEIVNTDLERERQFATFHTSDLTYFLYDGPEKTKRKRFLQNLVIQDAAKRKLKPYSVLSHEEQYELLLQKHAYFKEMENYLKLTDPTDRTHVYEAIMGGKVSPFGLHESAFIGTVQKLGSEEQKAKWLPLMKNYQMVGTYAQTELGHGSFLRGLETSATYDPKTKEFVLHSPTISSIKYWPGGLGKTANSCVVMAQLISKGENFGMHSFLVQIRDLDTHEPLPGVTVGDIGNKFGFGGNDNGFLKFNHFRIPRENLLMRYSQILEDGTYIRPKNDKLIYLGMTNLRVYIVGSVSQSLSKAVTIAVRYSAVRRQSEIEPGAGEVQVLDFRTQQYKLFPLIATAYATIIAGRTVEKYYNEVLGEIDKENLQNLPFLHALSAGLKAYCSWICTNGVEQCRLACGGHGYSQASNLPALYVNVAPACTYEGENTVLMLQTSRFIVKCCGAVHQGKLLPKPMDFLQLSGESKSHLDHSLNMFHLLEAYKHRAHRLAYDVSQKLHTAIGKGQNPGVAWNSNSVELIKTGMAFADMLVVQAFLETILTFKDRLRLVMENLWRLYAVNGIMNNMGDFMQDGYISSDQASFLQTQLINLLSELRPNAVALVDAFDFPDAVLDSALGRWDGNVYEALYEYSLQSKLNEKQVLDTYLKYQRPFMESQWKKSNQPFAKCHL